MLATNNCDADGCPLDDTGWVFEDKYDGFRMVAKIEGRKVTLYSRNGKIISHSYIEVAKALEGVKGDAVSFDLMFLNGEDLRGLTLLERKKRLRTSCRATS